MYATVLLSIWEQRGCYTAEKHQVVINPSSFRSQIINAKNIDTTWVVN